MGQIQVGFSSKKRGLARAVRAVEWVDQERVDELLELGFTRFEAASDTPMGVGLRDEFDRIYRPSALRLVDPRAWRLVRGQLLDWLTHVGQLASQGAAERGADKIAAVDLCQAVQEVHEISGTAYCPTPPMP